MKNVVHLGGGIGKAVPGNKIAPHDRNAGAWEIPPTARFPQQATHLPAELCEVFHQVAPNEAAASCHQSSGHGRLIHGLLRSSQERYLTKITLRKGPRVLGIDL
jgi:hypothetical protein